MNQHLLGQSINASSQEFNLNSLVIGQGGVQSGTQNFQSQNNLLQQQQQQQNQMLQGLHSGKSSSKLQLQPGQSPMNLNSRGEEEKRQGSGSRGGGNAYLDKPNSTKLSINRASSEPPTGNKNAVVPVQEDSQDEDIDDYNKGSQDVETNRVPPKIPGFGERTVPPLMISQVQSMQSQLALGQQQSSSNSVMNNYFNMPLGSFNTTMNQGFKLNFIPQNTLAKSRLTRRQMSMSRKQTLKLNSVSNFGQLIHGEESVKHKDSTVLNQQNSYDMQLVASQLGGGDQTQKSISQQRKGPAIPKLNINSIVNESSNNLQRYDAMGLFTTSHAAHASQLTHQNNHNKSSNRSNHISIYSNNNFENQLASAQQQKKMSSNLLMNYQTNQNVIRQQQNESEDHNISIYDEINGSFVDDIGLGEGQNGYIYDNAEEKLRHLAIQLGESCLTNDLAALISQKREIELVKSARKTAVNPRINQNQGLKQPRTMSLKPFQRSISVSYTAENIFKNKNSIKDFGDIMNQVTNLQNQRLIDLKNQKIQEIKTINQRTRIVVMNLAFMLLKKYDIEEVRFLKHPISALNAFIGSENFHDKIHLKQILALENQSILIDSNIDHEMAQDGKITITSHGRILNMNPTKISFQHPTLGGNLFDPTQLQQITEANQSDTEELNKDSETNNNNNNYLNTHENEQNDDSRFSYNIYGNNANINFERGNKFQSFYKLDSEEKLLAILKRGGSIFNQQIYQEEKVVFKIYKKFTFLNEDILRRQVMNELATFSAKDIGLDNRLYNALNSAKYNQNSSFANNIFMVNNLMNHGGSNMAPPISGTPIKSINNQQNLSFDEGDEDFYFRKERSQDGIKTLSNPNTLWFHNGIAYEVNTPSTSKSSSASSTVSKERLRKKLDVLLYTVDRRLKYIIQQYPDKTHSKFAEDLKKEISTINSYIEQQSSRIMLYQVIEVCLESILMIKKCIIDIALKTNIFIMDFSKHISQPDYFNQGSASYKIRTPQNQQSSAGMSRNSYLIDNQKAHRNMFSEYLRLVANLLRMKQTPESMKLLNEVLIFDEQWQESVKTFSISLFLSDVVSTITLTDRLSTQSISLMIEELRGINLINFEEPLFISQIMSTQNLDFYQASKESIYHLLLCSLNMMRYFKSVLHFFNNIVKLYFSNYGQQQKSSKYPASGGPDGADINKGNDMKQLMMGDKKTDFNSGQKNGTQGDGTTGVQNDVQLQKYWKQIIRKMLYQYMYLITPPNGLLSQYLQNNSINYMNISYSATSTYPPLSQSRMMSSPSKKQDQNYHSNNTQGSYRTGNPPLNFKLTKSVLSFTKLMFNLPDKFTKYVFIEELMLFYIRTHYISFVRLYNKNYSKKEHQQLFGNPGNNNIGSNTSTTRDISLSLCKKHLDCLFCIAKNRNEDTRRKLYQFKVVSFLTQEMELEFDVQQRRKRFIELSKEEQKKFEKEQQQQNENKILQDKEENLATKMTQNTTNTLLQQKPKLGFGVGLGGFKLNLAGVAGPSLFTGSDPLQTENQKLNDISQIVIDTKQNTVQEQQIQLLKGQNPPPLKQNLNLDQNDRGEGTNQSQIREEDQVKMISQQQPEVKKALPFGMKKLNITGLGLSELTQDQNQGQSNSDQTKQNQKPMNEEIKQEVIQLQQAQPKKLPFSMPKLNVAGLGLSELNQDDSLIQNPTAENNNNSAIQQTAKAQVEQNQQNQVPQKKLPFSMPKLNVAGLGLSELRQDDSYGQNLPLQIDKNPTKEEVKDDKQNHAVTIPQNQLKKMPFAMPKLNVAGLGLSELTPDNGIIQNQPSQNNNQALVQENQVDKSQQQSFQEDQQQPVTQQPKKGLPFGMKKLNITGLGLSELTPDTNNQTTLNLNANQLLQHEEQKSVQDQALVKKPIGLGFKIPALNVAGLGLSDLVKDENPQAQQQVPQNQDIQVQEQIEQQQPKKLGFQMPKLNINGLTLSELRPEDNQNNTQQLQVQQHPIQNQIEEMKTIDPNTLAVDNNKTIDYGALNNEQIFQKQQQQFDKTAPLKLFDVDDEKKTQSNSKQQRHIRQAQRMSDPSILQGSPEQSQLITGALQSQTGTNRLNQNPTLSTNHGMIINIPEEELDDKRKQMLMKNRVNLLPNKRKSVGQQSNQSSNRLDNALNQSESQNKQLFQRKNNDQIQSSQFNLAVNLGGPLKIESVADIQSNIYSPLNDHNIINNDQNKSRQQLIQPFSEEQQLQSDNKMETLQIKDPLAQSQAQIKHDPNSLIANQQTPSMINNSSRSSNGSFVGKNKVFVPFLNFPDDIFMDPSEKIKIYQKPDDNRFKLMKTKDGATPEIKREGASNNMVGGSGTALVGLESSIPSQSSLSASKPKGLGKRGKLLNINSNEGSANSSGNGSQGDQQDKPAGVRQLNFNFGKPDEELKLNSRPVNIPKPERKDKSNNNLQNAQNSNEENIVNNNNAPLIKVTQDPGEIFQSQSNYQNSAQNMGLAGLKKPLIPSLKIPQKSEQVEGKDKIKEQLQYAEELNKNVQLNDQGDLTKLEQQLNQQKNPKFQLLLDKAQFADGKNIQQSPNKKNNDEIEEKKQDQRISFQQNLDQNPSLAPGYAIQKEIQLTEANFYLKERNARPIYQDDELHVLMISLMTCLLLKPERGILDDLYCSQYPIDNGKQNILYLLHHHLNQNQNQSIIQRVLNKVQDVHPPLAGQRLLKLLCSQLFDLGLYNNGRNWKKIAEGAYAKVYEAETNLSEPKYVAIKQMRLPASIYDRCVLHDIFTEITCLEELRLEPCITDLYDFGVDNQCYYIVQKRYACSLREWRLKQSKSLNENLSIYLSIFREFLRSLQIIHSHNVTHYDIKCDNVLIDMSNSSTTSSSSNNITKLAQDEDRLKLAIADFGECKMFQDERDELCQRNRGTDYYKSPEMLQLTLNTRKDTDKYDRRKQVGTNRLSDIWSVGCMFYELLTGHVLFYNPDYFAFLNRVTRPSEALFTSDKLDLIQNNVYLVDFLKYMLVRDSRLRPSIDSVVKRFEHVHALLVSTTAQASTNNRFSLMGMQTTNRVGGKGAKKTLDHLLYKAQLLMIQNSLVFGGVIKEENMNQSQQQQQQTITNFNMLNTSIGGGQNLQGDDSSILKQQSPHKNASLSKVLMNGTVMQLLEDIYLISERWLKSNQLACMSMGITHVIVEQRYATQSLRDKFDVLAISDQCEEQIMYAGGSVRGDLSGMGSRVVGSISGGHENSNSEMNPFMMMTSQGVMDFLRKVALQRGKVAFIENSQNNGEIQLRNGIQQRLIRECLLICLNHIFSTNTYETYTLIRSQNLFFRVSSSRLGTLSKWSKITTKINQYMQTFPRFQCLCGSCLIILKRQYANYQSMQTITCNCSQYYKNVDSSQCPSPGCNEFLKYLKTYFKSVYQSQQPQMESLHWGFLEEDDFILGPHYLGQNQNNSAQKRMVMANMSQGIDRNSVIVSICEKKNQSHSNMRGAGLKEQLDFNLISKSSATVKNYGGGGAYSRWKMYKCKECHVWTHAVNEVENRYALLLNNRVKEAQSGINILAAVTSNQGGKSAQVNIAGLNAKQAGATHKTGVRVPILQKIKLTLPF